MRSWTYFRVGPLLTQAAVSGPVASHERLGTMIGANRVAVTRAFGLLQDEGVVELRRRLIHVTDIEALTADCVSSGPTRK